MDRSNFYFEQEVTQSEMDQAFDDVQAVAEQLITDHSAADSEIWGVFWGYRVQEQGIPDLTVAIDSGVAYDDQGRRIVGVGVGFPYDLDLSSYVPGSDSRYVRVYVEHDTVESDPRVDGAAVPLNYRIADSYAFSVDAGTPAASPTKPTIDTSKVLIATILLTNGQTQILDADISLALGNTYGPGIDETDRQEGGVVTHGRRLQRAIGFKYEVNGPPKLCMGRNELNMEQGDLLMDYFSQAPATAGGGGRVFMEDGRIYKVRLIRSGGPPQDSADNGYRYYEYNVGTDEFGDGGLAIDKPIVYTAEDFWPQNSNVQDDPWQQAAPIADNWYRDDLYDAGGPGGSPTFCRSAYRYRLINGGTGGTPLWGVPLVCSMKLPHGPRFKGFDLFVEVLAGGMPANVWVDLFIQRRSRSTMTMIGSTYSSPFNNATPGMYNVSVDVDQDLAIFLPTNYNALQACVLIRSETSALPNVRIWGGRARLHIREASWIY